MDCLALGVNLTKSVFAPDSESGCHQESTAQQPINSAPGVGLPPASLDSEKWLHFDSLIGNFKRSLKAIKPDAISFGNVLGNTLLEIVSWFDGNQRSSGSRVHYSGESGPVQTKSPGYQNAPPETPKWMQRRAPPNSKETNVVQYCIVLPFWQENQGRKRPNSLSWVLEFVSDLFQNGNEICKSLPETNFLKSDKKSFKTLKRDDKNILCRRNFRQQILPIIYNSMTNQRGKNLKHLYAEGCLETKGIGGDPEDLVTQRTESTYYPQHRVCWDLLMPTWELVQLERVEGFRMKK
ncbi:hypothetical protein MG293_010172 [Ovis ammon polii]|uniref:Uncharacterized protein n=1 Tax=Ovis ammon polii TaxID=230172 RepID=A0AAD4U4J6_OVIAM|nr:hypothetical protein MG293_010172 [Ovis ammon polii]